jgi:hypothetical protein
MGWLRFGKYTSEPVIRGNGPIGYAGGSLRPTIEVAAKAEGILGARRAPSVHSRLDLSVPAAELRTGGDSP